VNLALHLTALLALPPLLVGVIQRVKARVAGRRGPPMGQLAWDVARLLRKDVVLSRTTSWVFLAGPVVGLVVTLAAALLVPFGSSAAPVEFAGDLVLFAYLLALGRFFTVLAALDTGSAFQGMGAARDATWACLAEPALFLGLMAGVRFAGATTMAGVLRQAAVWEPGGAPMLLVALALLLVLLVENCRIPFDDPTTHLELTMVHEAMVLDHSGPPLALVLYGAAVKLFVYAAVFVRLVVPLTGSPVQDEAAFVAGILAVAIVIGLIESTTARVQLPRVPRLLISAALLSVFGLLLVAR
jgi:formate hydrogenlyase subunit 4